MFQVGLFSTWISKKLKKTQKTKTKKQQTIVAESEIWEESDCLFFFSSSFEGRLVHSGSARVQVMNNNLVQFLYTFQNQPGAKQ